MLKFTGQMTPPAEFDNSVTFLAGVYLPWLSGRESTSAEPSGMSASGSPARMGGKGGAYQETLWHPIRLVSESGEALSADASGRWHRRVRPACGNHRGHSGSRARERPQKHEKVPLAAQRRGKKTSRVRFPAGSLLPALAPRTPGTVPGAIHSSELPDPRRIGAEVVVLRLKDRRRFPRPWAGVARLSDPSAGPSGGNARAGTQWRVGGLGGAREADRRREFGESCRQRRERAPAVSLETC